MVGNRGKAHWEDKQEWPCRIRPEHPNFRKMLNENLNLLNWVDQRIRVRFDPHNIQRWPDGYFFGFLTDLFNRVLYVWTPERGKLSYYFDKLAMRHVLPEFLVFESEKWQSFRINSRRIQKKRLDKGLIFSYYSEDLDTYHDPEIVTDWAKELIAFFLSNEEAMNFLIDELRDREREVIVKRYVHGQKLPEIGRELGLCKERVRQIEAKALDKIRTKIGRTPDLRAYIKYDLNLSLPKVGVPRKAKKRKEIKRAIQE